MLRRASILALFLLGCGGGKAPATSPSAATTPARSGAATTAAGHDEPPAPSASASPPSGGHASEEDLRKAVQIVIDDPELDVRLHLNLAGRFPLKVSGEGLPSGLTKAMKPVELVTSPADDAPVLVITEIESTPTRVVVRYRFGAEKFKGSATVEKTDIGWQLSHSRFVERAAGLTPEP